MTNILDLTKQYFKYFSNKDIDSLSELFSEDITLKDWSVSASGKEQVLNVIKSIYNTSEQIAITPCLLVGDDEVIMAEILIHINSDILEVVDVIEYRDGKIKSIRAYKQ